ncbi:hypothetical protein EIN_498060 [Entamoeba invadens IP1]|uniref:Ras-GEF domain-containing protein n=1 Tax=Entamoeba invadens IP1 TaxID=370355 RepID=A0A0A1UDI6_ENTIV|nr:hypothetical protein EIN_498060 [Entamoeba invadens IP1]ELP94616.1 hypothetical protein EIN_498060 [Entamoeba invadens IP1]|eukprot:XP_004261387.1 hypothetical protein EIN_498060 [Entamoeba invadens IP1]
MKRRVQHFSLKHTSPLIKSDLIFFTPRKKINANSESAKIPEESAKLHVIPSFNKRRTVGIFDAPIHLYLLVNKIIQNEKVLEDELYEQCECADKNILSSTNTLNPSEIEEIVYLFIKNLSELNQPLFESIDDFDGIEMPFTNNTIVLLKIRIWRMSSNRRVLIKAASKIYSHLQNTTGTISLHLFKVLLNNEGELGIPEMIGLNLLLQCLDMYEKEIFEPNAHDPFFKDDNVEMQSVVGGRKETLVQILFDPFFENKAYLRQFVHTIPYIMTEQFFFEKVVEEFNAIVKEQMMNDDKVAQRQRRFETTVLTWIEQSGKLVAQIEPDVITKLKQSEILTSKRLSGSFRLALTEQLNLLQLSTRKVKVSLYTNNSFTQEHPSDLKLDSEIEELLSEKVSVLAEQLVLFDYKSFVQIKAYEAYLDCGNHSMQNYITKTKRIENMFLVLLQQNKTKIGQVIKIAKMCFELKGFNIAYILFSVLVKISIESPTLFAKTEKSKLSKFKALEDHFQISKNFANYRKILEKAHLPKVPVVSIWIHDIISINQMPLTFEGTDDIFNFQQLQVISAIVKEINEVQTVAFTIAPNKEIQNKLDALVKSAKL